MSRLLRWRRLISQLSWSVCRLTFLHAHQKHTNVILTRLLQDKLTPKRHLSFVLKLNTLSQQFCQLCHIAHSNQELKDQSYHELWIKTHKQVKLNTFCLDWTKKQHVNFQHLYPPFSGQRGSLFSFSLQLIFSFTFLHEIEKDFLEDVQSPTYRCCASVIFAKQCNAWRKISVCFSGSLSLLFQFLLILLLVFFLFKTKQNKNTFTYNNHQGWLGIKNQFSVARKQQAIYIYMHIV